MTTAGYADAFVVGGEFNVTPPAPVNGQKVPLQVDATGNLMTNAVIAGTVVANITQVGGASVSLGAKTSANSIPVVLASDEANLPVVGAENSVVTQTWSSGSAPNLVIPCSGYGTVVVDVACSAGTFTQGVAQFAISITGGTAFLANGMRVAPSGIQTYDASSSLVLATSQTTTYWFNCAGYDSVTVFLGLAIIGTGTVTVKGRAVAMPCPGPTTVGQSDASKLNATVIGASPASSTATWTSATPNFTFFTINCQGYNTVIFDIIPDAGSVSAGQFGVYGQMPGGTNGISLTCMRQINNNEQLYDSPRLTNFVGLQTARYIVNCAGYQTISLFLTQQISGTLNVALRGAASYAVTPGPTTVGQSDPTKLNVSVVKTPFTSAVSSPSSATDFTMTFGAAGVLKTAKARLATSANSGTRIPDFIIADANGLALYSIQPFSQGPSLTIDYYFGLALPFQTVATNGIVLCPIPDVVVGVNWTLKSTTVLQTGDQWSGITYSLQTS